MIYKSVSVETIIAKVIRNTRLTDTSAIVDIYEWVPEAMELLETRYQLSKEFKDLNVKFHQALLPCGLVVLDAVEHKGKRLDYSNTSSNYNAPPYKEKGNKPKTSIAQSEIIYETNPATGNQFISSTLEEVSQLPKDQYNSYYTKMNYICTSMKEACIRVFYQVPPLDESGFPLVPDNGNYKEAIYWWVRGKLIGSGQLNDPKNTEDSCLAKFEHYGARAINEITYPSIDQMERVRANQLRYIMPENYWENHYKI